MKRWARTPTMDALARQGMRFTNVFPEAMPTIPARNSILSGRRQFPFRGWYDRPGLLQAPGWEPLDHLDASFLSVLRRAGWWTSYVTDNPFLGYAPRLRPLSQQPQPLRAHGRPDRRPPEGLERAEAGAEPLALPREREREDAQQGRSLPRQQPPLGEPRQHVRRARLPQRAAGAEHRGRPSRSRSPSWSTPTSRTSPGRLPRASSTHTATGAAPSPRCPATAAPRTGSARASAAA